jgi:predicted RNA-binding protein YlqC (UPF0109 family)
MGYNNRNRSSQSRGYGNRRDDRRDSRHNDRYDDRHDRRPDGPQPDVKGLVEFIAKGMVDDAEAVSVTESSSRNGIFVELRVAQGEVGRVIGREGKLANAMRALLKVAGNRAGRRVMLDITD